MPIRAICFDLFHTLVDVGQVPESVGRFTADILGLDRQLWHEACFGPAHNIRQSTDAYETLLKLARSIAPDISPALVAQAVVERQARFDHSLIYVESETLAGLALLREQGIRLGLISNASSSEVQAWRQSPLAELFDVVSFSYECGHVKPEQAIYEQTLEALGVAAEHALFIGDGGSDEHFGAHAAGMRSVLISRYLETKEMDRRLDKYAGVLAGSIDCVSELIRFIARE